MAEKLKYKVIEIPEKYKDHYSGKTKILEVVCGKCGIAMSITHNHQIIFESDGTVTLQPSLVCPHDGCGWHVWVRHDEVIQC